MEVKILTFIQNFIDVLAEVWLQWNINKKLVLTMEASMFKWIHSILDIMCPIQLNVESIHLVVSYQLRNIDLVYLPVWIMPQLICKSDNQGYGNMRESVNSSQMDIKHKTFDIRTRKNICFFTYPPPTLIHLSHRFTSVSTCSIEVFWLLS
jgi:hypothetical protein